MACPDRLSSWQYAVWLVLWVGWNAFIICFYLEVGRLSQVMSPPASSSSLHPPSLSVFPSFLLSFLLLPLLHSSAPQKGPRACGCSHPGSKAPTWVLGVGCSTEHPCVRGMDRRMVQAKVAGGEALKRECKINEADELGIAGRSLITSMPSALPGFMGCRNWTVLFPNVAVRRESGEGTQGLGTSNDRKV